MASMLSVKHKFVFIHIPRTAGTSINNIFLTLAGKRKWLSIKNIKEEHKKYFKFAFVRNPWDRIVSSYFHSHKGGEEKPNSWIFKQFNSCEDFLEGFDKVDKKHIMYPLFSQSFWLKDENGKIGADFIGRFENLKRDFKTVCDKIEIKMDLEHLNKSDHKHYSFYYNDKTIEKIRKMYEEDIKLFKYVFENKKE